MNSSLVRWKTKSSSPSPESLACEAAAAALPALGPLDAVAAHVFAVAWVHHLALAAALRVAEHRLGDVALGDVDVLAALHVANAAPVHRALDRLANLVLVAPQKALSVADGLVLARQPPVDDLLQHRLTIPVS